MVSCQENFFYPPSHVHLHDDILLGGQNDVILLDFSKTFDKVPHKSSLLKLDFCGLRGKIKRWTEDFLSNRTQQVVVESKYSYTL